MKVFHLAVAGVAVAGVGLAACASSPATRSVPAFRPAHSAPPAPSWAGLLRASPNLTDRLVLNQTHVTAGTPIKGTLVVINHGPPINLTRGCRPRYAVVLTNSRFPPDVAWPLDCSLGPFIIAPGVTRLGFTVMTSYRSCVQQAQQTTDLVPACLHGRQVVPPFPPGRYTAVLVGDGLALPYPAPVLVTLSAVPAE